MKLSRPEVAVLEQRERQRPGRRFPANAILKKLNFPTRLAQPEAWTQAQDLESLTLDTLVLTVAVDQELGGSDLIDHFIDDIAGVALLQPAVTL